MGDIGMIEITKEEFEAFVRVRDSGVTNMFDVKVVSRYTGLSGDKIFDIIMNFDILCEKYPEVEV